MSLLIAHGLSKFYRPRGLFRRGEPVAAVDGVSLTIEQRRTLGLVGESGSGKSTTGRLLLGLEQPDAGRVRFDGEDLPKIGTPAWQRLRADIQMVFQNPLAALDPRVTILRSVGEPLDIHLVGSAEDRTLRVNAVLEAVGLGPELAGRLPHELSGGQLQRAVLARALITEPRVLICDEPVSALDVSIQAQVINKLVELRQQRGLGILFISHDLRLVRHICDEVAVMYLGRVVEQSPTETLFRSPQHPYTRALIAAVPQVGVRRQTRTVLAGEPPNPALRPTGCAFHPRCPEAIARCRTHSPNLVTMPDGRKIACHLVTPPARVTARDQAA